MAFLTDLITILLALLVGLVLAVYLFVRAEIIYSGFFDRPFFVHFYLFPKKLSKDQLGILELHSSFYRGLSTARKRYFEHRIFKFLEKYSFVGQEGFEITPEVKVRVAIPYIMLSFGWRDYLTNVFTQVHIYPSVYHSESGTLHKGEFDPSKKRLLFSWADFISGERISSDNLNLAIHEFAHVLQFHSASSPDISARLFSRLYVECMKLVLHPDNSKVLRESGYFRDYAFTDKFEFLAVVLEHYFETPGEFRQKFPWLFSSVSKMLNHRH